MIGTKLSHYLIEAELGRGGMGVVYRAYDERLRRKVALKHLPDEIASQAERRARILTEARAAAALNHPGITTIYEVGEEGGHLFIVMELVSGETLRAKLAEGPIEPRALLRLGTHVAEALAAAHAQGVAHGDIKPENIIVQPDGRVKLLDFGIARQMVAETANVTRTGTSSAWLRDSEISGTLAYMAPEQLRDDPVDQRADLFSFGVVLYELAAGERPFSGRTVAVLMSHILYESPPPLSTLPKLPAGLERIVFRLLEKKPELRYQTAHELMVDLTNLARALELGATPPAAVAGKRTLAVLPFKLLTPNPEDEYLSVALADAVINQLSVSGELLVRPTNTVIRYAKQAVDPLMAARELNVQLIVDGSIQKFGQKLRVHVQAWNAADGSTLLSAKHDSEMLALFTLQDRLAEGLAEAFGMQTKAREEVATAPPTKNAMAYELFLRAIERMRRLNRWDVRSSVEMLQSATKLDPHFADAWARLAEACVLMAVSLEPGLQWFRRAEGAIRRALVLDPNNAEAQCARGQVLWTPAKRFQHRAALQTLGHALRINPGTHQARLWRCLIFLHIGLLEEARDGLRTVLASNPDDAFTLVFTGQTAFYRGDYDEAEEYHARALSVDPANLWANIFFPTIPLYNQQLEKAEEKIRAAGQVLPGDPWLASCEALLWAKRGEHRKAEQALRRALRGGKPLLHTHHMWHTAAAAYAVIGKHREAITLLRKASRGGLPCYPTFRDEPHFQSLHAHPQFLRLMADLKREWEGYKREFGGAH